jgi:hypothetical protein
MTKSITIHDTGSTPADVHISYDIAYLGNEQMITCNVNEAHYPLWLQLRKFTLLSLNDKKGFVPIFIEVNNSKNMATTLFIDKVYEEIMHAEKFKVLSESVC